ncbi:MAG: hypothetical protein GEV05_05910 [Betaproteobacteria bacterium]|nr:hypothetical protein [Betaproteobacteria bacterium]
MREPNIDPQKLVATFLLGAVLFNYPILSLFNRAAAILGIPVVYAYIFLAWGGLIALTVWIVERRR